MRNVTCTCCFLQSVASFLIFSPVDVCHPRLPRLKCSPFLSMKMFGSSLNFFKIVKIAQFKVKLPFVDRNLVVCWIKPASPGHQ